ncbi:MAG TPA: hypothetical protein VIV60_04655, partial [Polyangiaceae bacterium]
ESTGAFRLDGCNLSKAMSRRTCRWGSVARGASVLFALSLTTLGCSPSSSALSPTPAQCAVNKPAACVQAPPSYDVVKPIVARYCTSCHRPGGSAGEDHDFTQLAVIVAQREAIVTQLTNCAMPPKSVPKPLLEERQALVDWASCRASGE